MFCHTIRVSSFSVHLHQVDDVETFSRLTPIVTLWKDLLSCLAEEEIVADAHCEKPFVEYQERSV